MTGIDDDWYLNPPDDRPSCEVHPDQDRPCWICKQDTAWDQFKDARVSRRGQSLDYKALAQSMLYTHLQLLHPTVILPTPTQEHSTWPNSPPTENT